MRLQSVLALRLIRALSTGLLLVLAAGVAPAQAAEPDGEVTTRKIRGKAVLLDGGGVAYRMSIRERWQGDKLRKLTSTMKAPDGTVIAKETISPSGDPLTPNHRLEHPVLGRLESVKKVGSGYKVRFRETAEDDEETKVMKPPGTVAYPGTLVPLFRHLWSKLMAGKTVEFSMIVPDRMDWFTFEATGRGTAKKGKHQVLVIDVRPVSVFLRPFAGDMRFYLDVKHQALVGFKGRVNIRDAEADPYEVKVTFNKLPAVYEPPPEAKPAEAPAPEPTPAAK